MIQFNTKGKTIDVKFFTSYHGAMRALSNEEIVSVSISRYNPKWFRGETITEKKLSPTSDMFSLSEEEYIPKFKAILERTNFDETIKSVIAQAHEQAVVRNFNSRDHLAISLNCYEMPFEFCHRKMVGEWIAEKSGEKVEEFNKREHALPKVEQSSLDF